MTSERDDWPSRKWVKIGANYEVSSAASSSKDLSNTPRGSVYQKGGSNIRFLLLL